MRTAAASHGVVFFSPAAINLAKLKLFRHYYVLVSKKFLSVNKVNSRNRADELAPGSCGDFIEQNQAVAVDMGN